MNSFMLKTAALSCLAMTAVGAASAGEWVLNRNLCPDLVEDRIDARVTTSRRDAREDVQDMRQINCPRSAWTYHRSRGEAPLARGVRYTGTTTIHVGRGGYYQQPVVVAKTHNVRRRKNKSPALVKIMIR